MSRSSVAYEQCELLTGAWTRLVHALHLQKAAKAAGQAVPAAFSCTPAELERLAPVVNLGLALSKRSEADFKAWANGTQPDLDAGLVRLRDELPDAADGTPGPVLRAWLQERAPQASETARAAVASLVQLCLLVDRDGDLLQDLYRCYLAVGLPVCFSDLGLPSDHAALEHAARVLAARTTPCPFDTTALGWEMALQKVTMWGEKNSGRRDKHTLARELLADPEVQALLPALKAQGSRRIGILGHSMTMSLHWTTHGSWCEVACELLKLVQPGVEYASFQAGGLTPTRAIKEGLADRLLDWRPREALLYMFLGKPEDRASLAEIVRRLKAAEVRIQIVDDIRPWTYEWYQGQEAEHAYERELCAREGADFLDMLHRHRSAKDWESWKPLGGDVHLHTPAHLFYAKELLKDWSAPRRRSSR
ncbi:MAG: hypothetical protein HS116_03665 [Planctomycetes bacterium]|nr:hypothetical protein [Planctomycetota bacterium]